MRSAALLSCLLLCTAVPAGRSDDTAGAAGAAVGAGGEGKQHQEALSHLLRGNDLSAEGRHIEAIAEWEAAGRLRPDSNVPWNNVANAFMALGDLERAREAAEWATRIKLDYMSSTTLGNVLKALKRYEEAESVLLRGCEASDAAGDAYEHPFWSLANIYHEQGDYALLVEFGVKGLDRISHPLCAPEAADRCFPRPGPRRCRARRAHPCPPREGLSLF